MRIAIIYIILLIIVGSCGNYFSHDNMTEIPSKQQSFRTGIVSYLDDQIRKHPDQIALYIEKAQIYKEEGWPNDALPTLNRAIEIDSTSLEAYQLRSSFFISKGRFKDALRDIRLLERKGVQDQQLINDQITAYYGQQNLSKFYESATKFTDDLNAVNRKFLSEYFLKNGDSLLAIRHAYLNYLNGHLKEEDKIDLINLLMDKNFIDQSSDLLLTLNSKEPESELAKATLLMKMGEEQKSLKIIRNLAEKGVLVAVLKLNDYYLSKNLPDSALIQNDYYLTNYDSSVLLLKQQAMLYQNRYKWSKSVEYLQIVTKKDPSDEEAQQELSKVRGKIAYLRSLKSKQDTTSF